MYNIVAVIIRNWDYLFKQLSSLGKKDVEGDTEFLIKPADLVGKNKLWLSSALLCIRNESHGLWAKSRLETIARNVQLSLKLLTRVTICMWYGVFKYRYLNRIVPPCLLCFILSKTTTKNATKSLLTHFKHCHVMAAAWSWSSPLSFRVNVSWPCWYALWFNYKGSSDCFKEKFIWGIQWWKEPDF